MKKRKAYFKKNGREVLRPRSVVYNGCTYVPPTDEILLAAGFEIREIEVEEPALATYEDRVVQLIREKYSIDDELAILRQRDNKPEEFAVYNEYCEKCKDIAKENIYD